MAQRQLSRRISLGSVPRWVALAAIIVSSRLVSTTLMLWFANRQSKNPWTAAQPDLFEFSRIWDAHWYRIIAEVGYPSELPVDDNGRIGESAWAFMPVYPLLVRAVMSLTTVPFAYVSVAISVVSFVGFILIADRFFRRIVGDSAALAAVAVIAFAPVSPVFQVGYAESLGMLLVAGVLLALTEKRWWWAAALIPLAALTRPVGVPLTLALVFLTFVTIRTRTDRVPLVTLTAWAAIATVAWPAIAWLVTGRMTAYLDTEFAWRRPYIGDSNHGWGTGWWESAQWWFPDVWPWVLAGIGTLVIAIAIAPSTRRLGAVALSWVGAYSTYLVVVFFPQSSVFRLLAPLFPLAGIVARSRWATWTALVAGVIGQYFWIQWMWSVEGRDWTPP